MVKLYRACVSMQCSLRYWYARSNARPIRKLGRCTRALIWNPNRCRCIKIAGNHRATNIFVSYLLAHLLSSPPPLMSFFSSFFLTFWHFWLSGFWSRTVHGNDIMITLYVRRSPMLIIARLDLSISARSPDANISLVVGFGRFQCYLEGDPRARLRASMLHASFRTIALGLCIVHTLMYIKEQFCSRTGTSRQLESGFFFSFLYCGRLAYFIALADILRKHLIKILGIKLILNAFHLERWKYQILIACWFRNLLSFLVTII